MTRTCSLLAACLYATTSLAADSDAKEDPRESCYVEMQVCRILDSDALIMPMGSTADQIAYNPQKNKFTMLVVQDGLRIGWPGLEEHTITFGDTGLERDGSGTLEGIGIVQVARPHVCVGPGEKAEVAIGDEHVEYFEPAGPESPGLYRHKKAEQRTGMLMIVTGSRKDDDVMDIGLRLTTAELAGRETLDGVGLDVGPPSIAHSDTDINIRVKAGRWYALVKETEAGGYILILVRAANRSFLPPGMVYVPVGIRQFQLEAKFLRLYGETAPVFEKMIVPVEGESAVVDGAQAFAALRSHPPAAQQDLTLPDALDWLEERPDAELLSAPRITLVWPPSKPTPPRDAAQRIFPYPDRLPESLERLFERMTRDRSHGAGIIADVVHERQGDDWTGIACVYGVAPGEETGRIAVECAFAHRERWVPKARSGWLRPMGAAMFGGKAPEPVLEEQDVHATICVEDGGWMGFLLPEKHPGERLAILLSVSELKSAGGPASLSGHVFFHQVRQEQP